MAALRRRCRFRENVFLVPKRPIPPNSTRERAHTCRRARTRWRAGPDARGLHFAPEAVAPSWADSHMYIICTRILDVREERAWDATTRGGANRGARMKS